MQKITASKHLWLLWLLIISLVVACGGDDADPAVTTPSPAQQETIDAALQTEVTATETAVEAATATATAADEADTSGGAVAPDVLVFAVVSVSSANVRSGPGTNFEVVTIAAQDERLSILAKNNDGSWYNVFLDNGDTAWIAASVVTTTSEAEIIPIAATVPAASGGNVSVPAGGSCSCAANTLNCTDFANQADAQSCYDFCLGQVGIDIHGLDTDQNGEACKGL